MPTERMSVSRLPHDRGRGLDFKREELSGWHGRRRPWSDGLASEAAFRWHLRVSSLGWHGSAAVSLPGRCGPQVLGTACVEGRELLLSLGSLCQRLDPKAPRKASWTGGIWSVFHYIDVHLAALFFATGFLVIPFAYASAFAWRPYEHPSGTLVLPP